MGEHRATVGPDGVVTMPAGEYWVGDPCYAVPDDRWAGWLEAARADDGHLLAEIDGRPVLGIGTSYGDGTYSDRDGRQYPVDAGLIGAVPVEVAEEEAPFGMHRVSFGHPFHCLYQEPGGTISIGHIDIQTDPPEEEEEHDPYYDDQPDEDRYPTGEDL